MTRPFQQDDMSCSMKNPYSVWKTRLFRKCRFESSSLLLVFVSAYVFLFLIDAVLVLTAARPSDDNRVVNQGNGDPMSLASLTQKMKSIADNKILKHVDLSLPINDVSFKENRRKLLCFEWDSVNGEINNQILSEQEQSPEEVSRPAHSGEQTGPQRADRPTEASRPAHSGIVPHLLRLLGNTEYNPLYPNHPRERKLDPSNGTDKSQEPGLLAPASPTAAILKALYRRAISHAVEVIKDTVNDEPITSCAFPGFSQGESQLIWAQASRSVRIKHTCARYTAFLYPTDAANDVIWAPRDNLGYCHQMEAGPNIWMKFLLGWNGEKVDAGAAFDDAEAESRLRQLYPPQTSRLMAERQTPKPLLFSVVGHPFVRIVSAYVNHIKRHYRYESSPDWIKEVRGKTFQELINSIRKNIVAKHPALARRGALNQLMAPVGGFGKHNKVRRQSNSTDTRLNFREFVWLAIKQNLECFNDIDCLSQVDPHWRPQYIWCSPCSLSFDLIIKDETFQKDSNLLLKLLGKPTIPDAVAETTNNSEAVQAIESSPSDASNIKTNNNSDSNSTSSPVGEEKKEEPFLPLTSDVKGSTNTVINEKLETVPKIDLYDIIEDQIDDGLPRQELAHEYLSYLTNEEFKMLYVTYTYDFTLFGYDAAEY